MIAGRSAFFPPAYGDLRVWLDPNDLSTITKDGSDRVSQWDSRVNGFVFPQATASRQPLWESNSYGTQAGIKFDNITAVKSILSSAAASTWNFMHKGPCTIFILFKIHTDLGGNGWLVNTGSNTTGNNHGTGCLITSSETQRFIIKMGSQSTISLTGTSGNIAIGTEHLFICAFEDALPGRDDGIAEIYDSAASDKVGQETQDGLSTSDPTETLRIGSRIDGSSGCKSIIAGILIYDGRLSQAFEDEIRLKWQANKGF